MSLCQQLSGRDDLLDKNLRRDLFLLFHEWSYGAELLSEEHTKKKLNTVVAQIREPDKKSNYQEMLQEHLGLLQSASCLAISAVLIGPMWENVTDLSQSKVCQWINNLLNHKLDPLKRVAR